MPKRRRLNADISEPLYLSLSLVCERLAVSKTQFVEKALIAALHKYCQANPELAK
ncbi:hypothetical protein [Microseira wollei]|uniref:hypothetical protein n=1 Tax=Microseira wollei TaxID=467598 RepID=UPI001CFC894E|nr:hypothetical protein [Microseira wollei]